MNDTAELKKSGKNLTGAMTCISIAAAFLIGGYEFSRSAMASLFIETFGSDAMPYAMTVVPILVGVLIFCYGRILTRLGSLRTLQLSLGFSAFIFLCGYFTLEARSRPVVAALYIFTEAYIVILVEQFWSFINSTLDQSTAKVYNGPILGGASLGPIAAGFLLSRFVVQWGSESFILLSGLALVPTAFLSYLAYRLAGEPHPTRSEAASSPGPLAWSLILKTKVLVGIACMVCLSQVFATVVTLRLYQLLEVSIPLKDDRTAYLGAFWAMSNGLAFVMQFFVTPLLLGKVSFKKVLMVLPLIHMATALGLLFFPVLSMAAVCLCLFKGMDYSLFRASKEMLYIPLSFDARYRAKQIVDAFNYRFSKGMAAGLISLSKAFIAVFPGWVYPAVALSAAGAWLISVIPLAALRPHTGNKG